MPGVKIAVEEAMNDYAKDWHLEELGASALITCESSSAWKYRKEIVEFIESTHKVKNAGESSDQNFGLV